MQCKKCKKEFEPKKREWLADKYNNYCDLCILHKAENFDRGTEAKFNEYVNDLCKFYLEGT